MQQATTTAHTEVIDALEREVIFIRNRRVEPDGSLHSQLTALDGDIQIEKSYSDSFLETDLK